MGAPLGPCIEPTCSVALEVRPASVKVKARMTIATSGDGGVGVPTAAAAAAATAVTNAAYALVAKPASAISSSLGVAVLAKDPVSVQADALVPMVVAPPPPSQPPELPPPSQPPMAPSFNRLANPDSADSTVIVAVGSGLGGVVLLLLVLGGFMWRRLRQTKRALAREQAHSTKEIERPQVV